MEKNKAEIDIVCMYDREEERNSHNMALEGLTEKVKFQKSPKEDKIAIYLALWRVHIPGLWNSQNKGCDAEFCLVWSRRLKVTVAGVKGRFFLVWFIMNTDPGN